MPLPAGKVSPSDVLNFTMTYFKRAASRTNITSKKEIAQMKAQELKLIPQDVGTYARRISMSDQIGKTSQRRFIDMMG